MRLSLVFGIAIAALACACVHVSGGVTFPPPRPIVPAQFRAKGKVWLGSDVAAPPLLLLYHHDELHARSREDYYHLVGTRHERFYTSIKLQRKGQNFMILHKQSKSPRACFILPLTAPLFDTAALDTAVYVGPATVQWWTTHIDRSTGEDAMRDDDEPHRRSSNSNSNKPDPELNSPSADGSESGGLPRRHVSNVTCLHWRMAYDGERVELCVDPQTGHPVLIHHPFIRVHIIDWSVGATSTSGADDSSSSSGGVSFSNALFDPDRASVAKCAPFGTSTLNSRN